MNYLIFDLDNTLYDHAEFVCGAHHCVARRAAELTGIDEGVFFKWIFNEWKQRTSRANTIFKEALAIFSLKGDKLEEQLVQAYRSHTPDYLPLFPGIDEALKSLCTAPTVRISILTDGTVEVQQAKLRALQITNRFDLILITGSLGRDFYKPSTKGFEILRERFNAPATQFTYIGDNPYVDFKPAKTLGMKTLRVLTGEYGQVRHGEQWIDHSFSNCTEAISWYKNTIRLKGKL